MKNESETGNLCQYAIPGQQYMEGYQYPYKCAVFCVCRYIEPTEEKAWSCPRKAIGDRKGITKEDAINKRKKLTSNKKGEEIMTDQDYRELTAAVKESGIALPMQKELQRLIDKEYIGKSCTSATEERGENG